MYVPFPRRSSSDSAGAAGEPQADLERRGHVLSLVREAPAAARSPRTARVARRGAGAVVALSLLAAIVALVRRFFAGHEVRLGITLPLRVAGPIRAAARRLDVTIAQQEATHVRLLGCDVLLHDARWYRGCVSLERIAFRSGCYHPIARIELDFAIVGANGAELERHVVNLHGPFLGGTVEVDADRFLRLSPRAFAAASSAHVTVTRVELDDGTEIAIAPVVRAAA